MPTPIGHALGGLAAGWLLMGIGARGAGRGERRRGERRKKEEGRRKAEQPLAKTWAIVFAGLGMLPDVDLILGSHSTYTHSVGAVLLVAAVSAIFVRRDRLVAAIACGAAYASHLLLDWLGHDTTPPIGIMALWPFTSSFYEADLHVFMAVSRRYWLEGFWIHNLKAVAREVVILLPIALVIRAWGRQA
jgi:LexA-binding, inner membrane-associated putative hydrolase